MNKYFLTYFSKDVIGKKEFINADKFSTDAKGFLYFVTNEKVTALYDIKLVAINHIEYGCQK